MKLGPVTNLDKRNKTTSKNGNDVTSANCDVIIFFPIYGQFGAIWKPDRKAYSVKLTLSLKCKLTKNENRTK